MQVTVIGAGSWGSALAILLARNCHDVTLVAHEEEQLRILRNHRENIQYLSGFIFPENVAFAHAHDPFPEAELTVVAVPSGAVHEVARSIPGATPLVVVASKGLEIGTARLMTQVVSDSLPTARVGGISGPNLALEIVQGIPTAAVSAFANEEDAEIVRRAFMCRTFRVYITNDVVGVELAGALKNVFAIAAGMSDGLGFGDNTKGALLARGLREMTLLGVAMGARMETFMGIAGVGDLFATAASVLSRNYRVGRALGEGAKLPDILQQLGQVAEGVTTAECAGILAKRYSVETPVLDAVQLVLSGALEPIRGVGLLMERSTPYEGVVPPKS